MRQRFNDLADQANEGYSAAKAGMISLTRCLGVTAFLLWAARRAGGWQNLQSTATDYMRDGYTRAREGYDSAREVIRDRTARFKGQAQEIAE